MKRLYPIAFVLLLVLTGCAGVRVGPSETITIGGKTITIDGQGGFDPTKVTKPDPHNPNVFVGTDGIVVDQEPIRPTKWDDGWVYISWALDASSGNTWPDNDAIHAVTDANSYPPSNPPVDFGCGVVKPRKVITCSYKKPQGARQFKYSIRIADKDGNEIARLDPWVVQP
jgi:hypothetical protein